MMTQVILMEDKENCAKKSRKESLKRQGLEVQLEPELGD